MDVDALWVDAQIDHPLHEVVAGFIGCTARKVVIARTPTQIVIEREVSDLEGFERSLSRLVVGRPNPAARGNANVIVPELHAAIIPGIEPRDITEIEFEEFAINADLERLETRKEELADERREREDGQECPQCLGDGYLECVVCGGESVGNDGAEECPECGGSGESQCMNCLGEGRVDW